MLITLLFKRVLKKLWIEELTLIFIWSINFQDNINYPQKVNRVNWLD